MHFYIDVDLSENRSFILYIGAYYYYNTEANKTYEQTMKDVFDYAQREKIPYRFVSIVIVSGSFKTVAMYSITIIVLNQL